MAVTRIVFQQLPNADLHAIDGIVGNLQLLVYAMLATHPNLRAVSDDYQRLFTRCLELWKTSEVPNRVEALNVGHGLVTTHLDQLMHPAPGSPL